MFPIYMYVNKYKGLKEFKINFDNNYEIKYNRKKDTLSINNKCESENNNIKNFYSIDKTKKNIDSVNLLVGKNGSGKTSILEMLNLSKGRQEIDYMIIYKSVVNNEDFIIEKNGLSKVIKIKDSKEIKLENKLLRYHSDKNYIKSTGVIKFSFKEKVKSVAMRDFEFFNYRSKDNIYKLNMGLEDGSKENIYNYLIEIKQEINNNNFENAYLTLIIPNSYEEFILEVQKIREIVKDLDSNDNIEDLVKLYDINKKDIDIKDIILNNYFNYLYILRNSSISNEKIFSKKELLKKKNRMLELLNNKSFSDKIKLFLKKNEDLESDEYIYIYDYDIKEYEIIKEISNFVEKKQIKEMNVPNYKVIKKFRINCKNKNKKIMNLLKKYDSFHVPNLEKKGRSYISYLSPKSFEFIKIEEEGLSDGEKIKLQYFSTLHGVLNGEFKDREFITLLFDEVETYLHPEWCRRFLYELIEELGRYKDKKFKLIFATHSPFLIADVLAKDCIYLSKSKKGKIQAEIKEDVKTFGANIIDLFKNTMFLESTFGKFATEKIKGIVHKIEKAEKYSDIKHEVDFVIGEIGEKLISNKLKSMIESKFKNKYEEEKDEEYYRKKIEEYQAKLEKLGNKENNKNS